MYLQNHKDRLTGIEHMLNRIEWQFFFSFTFKYSVNESAAMKAYKGFTGKASRAYLGRSAQNRKDLLHFAQIEFGKSKQHLHLHGCLAGLPETVTASMICELWKKRIHEGGCAKVSKYDMSRDGVSYALKIRKDAKSIRLMQTADSWPIYSESIAEALRRRGDIKFLCE